TIVTGEPNDGIFSWLVDVAPTTQARVRVIAHDTAANIGVDESDADFIIYDGEPPMVAVIQPNGGENYAVDSFFDIMWNATDNIGVTSVDILLSSDGGATYPHTIATGESNDGIFSWLVDVAPTTQARVRVIAYDAAANVGADESDADFTIYDAEPPVVTVDQPDGGEYYAVDSFFDILWTATDNIGVTSIDILLSSDGGATYPHTIATGEANDGIFSWLVDVAPTTQARIRVIAYDAAGNVGADESNGDFTLYDGEPPVVTVIQPNGGENYAVDSFFDIMWTATDNIGVTSIDILLSSDGGATYPHTIATGEPNDGIFSWLVDVAPTTQARIRVIAHDAAGNVGVDESNGDFTLYDGEPPVVTVIQPNGGENYAVDSFFDIMWTATDDIGVTSIDILLSSDGGATYPHTIVTGEPNDGIFSWLVDVAPTTQARIRVIAYDAAANAGADESDADFEIYDAEPPLVTVTQPNGGENWAVDSFFDIMWTATDNIGVTSIDILLSSDGGATYPHTIATGEPNDGIFSWLVDVAPTTQARVMVIAYDAAGNVGDDWSNADFTIYDDEPPQVTVVQPNGGEVWDIDSFFDIMWNATDDIGVTSIDILLSSDGGATYPHTIATGEPNDGIFSWLVDAAPTTQARVKVIAHDAAANFGEDESDSDFEIYDPAAGVDITGDIPLSAVITGNSPNPFAETTEIRFGIPVDGRARLAVYDVSGREVDLVMDQVLPAGYHSVDWRNGENLSMGLYFIKLRTGSQEVTHKVVISR
ncbi:T9SS type A sorting domain-containing protein, partial [Candidatus Eisenbacteria bacterium]